LTNKARPQVRGKVKEQGAAPAINPVRSILSENSPMKYGLIMMYVLCCSLSLGAQRSTLPSPDRYPADSIIVLLREDTAANQSKAIIIKDVFSVFQGYSIY